MGGVGELHQDTVLAGRQADEDEGVSAGVDEVPGSIVHRHMDMAEARRDEDGLLPEHRHDPQVLGTVRNVDPALRKQVFQRRIDDEPRRRLVADRGEAGAGTGAGHDFTNARRSALKRSRLITGRPCGAP